MKIQLHYIKPYSFEHTFRRLRYFEKTAYTHQGGMFMRAIHGERGLLVLQIAHNEKQQSVDIKIQGESTEGDGDSLKQRLSRMFSTDVDLGSFYQHFDQGDPLWNVIEQRKGMHLVTDPSLYECLMKTIISQQLNISFAATLIRRFIDVAGSQVEVNGNRLTVFPTPEKVAELQYEDLQQLQFNRKKAEYLIDISRKVVEGELDLETLYEKTDEEVLHTLLPLRGVGRWTVECLLLFGLARPDLLPAADIGLRNALRNVYQLPEQPSEEMVREMAKDWSPFSSYVTFYLWDSLSE